VASIYEGTSGIQALDFLKRKVLADKGVTLQKLLDLIAADIAAASTPFTAPLQDIIALLKQTVQRLLVADSPEDGAYALLQLAGCAAHGWNGHTLFAAATGGTPYQVRLRAALELHAASLADAARLWAGKAVERLPDYRFSAD